MKAGQKVSISVIGTPGKRIGVFLRVVNQGIGDRRADAEVEITYTNVFGKEVTEPFIAAMVEAA